MSLIDQTQDLSKILTPTLFSAIVQNRIPWPSDSPLNFAEVGQYTFSPSESVTSAFNALVFPALKALTLLPLQSIPDLLTFLPPPSSPKFPSQAQGLQLLVDQGPRSFCSGVDERWVVNFFDPLSQTLARKFYALPLEQRPDTRERWVEELKCSEDYWLNTQVFFTAPLVHSERHADHIFIAGRLEELRTHLETVSGKADPWRKEEEMRRDLFAFPKVIRLGAPKGENVTAEEFMFWSWMLMDVHFCIVEKYGRYPYRNKGAGRESRSEEVEWVKKAEGFGEADEEAGKRIREDVESGVWTPFGVGLRSDND
jgi:uncharacterized protein (DUF924 family)